MRGAGIGFALWIGWLISGGKLRGWLGFALLMGVNWVRRGEVVGQGCCYSLSLFVCIRGKWG